MFGSRKVTQSYAGALALVEQGRASILNQQLYDGSHPEAKGTITPVKDIWELRGQVYGIFAGFAPSHIQSFVCGPFTEWNGCTSPYFDGAGFVWHRQAFMDALQHFRESEAGPRYIWDFLTTWWYKLEVIRE